MSGKYWDQGLTVAEGCLHGCEVQDKCWGGKMHHQYKKTEFLGAVRFVSKALERPLKRKKPTVYHLWSDIFDLMNSPLGDVFDTISSFRHHKFLALTKRPEAIRKPFERCPWNDLPNLYIGVSVTDQRTADERIPALLNSSWKGKTWVNIEPMMGPVDLIGEYVGEDHLRHERTYTLDQVVLGGQMGAGAKRLHRDWARGVRDQCKAAGVPFFLKQVNEKSDRIVDGREHNDLIWR